MNCVKLSSLCLFTYGMMGPFTASISSASPLTDYIKARNESALSCSQMRLAAPGNRPLLAETQVVANPFEYGCGSGGIIDCNHNGVSDSSDISSGISRDINLNGIPDECSSECDITITGQQTFPVFQEVLITVNDTNADGIKWICLDGAIILNAAASTSNGLEVTRPNIYLYGRPGTSSSIRSQRNANYVALANNALHLTNTTGFRISNVLIDTSGMLADGILSDNSQVALIDKVTIDTGSFYSDGIELSGGSVATISDISITTAGQYSRGICLSGDASIDTIKRGTISTTYSAQSSGAAGQYGILMENDSAIDEISDLTISTRGLWAHGVALLHDSQIYSIKETDFTMPAAVGVYTTHDARINLVEGGTITSGKVGILAYADSVIDTIRGVNINVTGSQVQGIELNSNGNMTAIEDSNIQVTGSGIVVANWYGPTAWLGRIENVYIRAIGPQARGVVIGRASSSTTLEQLLGTTVDLDSGNTSCLVVGPTSQVLTTTNFECL